VGEWAVNSIPMKILEFFSTGFYVIVDAYTNPRDYVRPSEYGFINDQANLIGDVREFGNDMRRVIGRKHVERAYQGSGHR
jgi:hypothetical protein